MICTEAYKCTDLRVRLQGETFCRTRRSHFRDIGKVRRKFGCVRFVVRYDRVESEIPDEHYCCCPCVCRKISNNSNVSSDQ